MAEPIVKWVREQQANAKNQGASELHAIVDVLVGVDSFELADDILTEFIEHAQGLKHSLAEAKAAAENESSGNPE